MFKHAFTIFLLLLFLSGCDNIEFSPNQAFDRDSPVNLNAKNLKLLKERPILSDTLRFILSGDTQRAYDQAVDLVKVANKIPNLDFLIINGDISDFGLLQEKKWIYDIFKNLKVPYIGVVGNHDLIANGVMVYEKMFGDFNFSFIYKGVKFICHDTNSREYNFNGKVPDLNWIKKELQNTNDVEGIISVAHIPPRSGDFDSNLRTSYEELLNSNPKTIASLHSHENDNAAYFPFEGSIPFIVSEAVINREFLYVEIYNGKLIKYENIKY
jgi:hypothetical protein